MPTRKMNISDITPFDYRFDGSIGGQMTDVGRNIRRGDPHHPRSANSRSHICIWHRAENFGTATISTNCGPGLCAPVAMFWQPWGA